MVSACALYFDDLEIAIQKAGVPDEFIYLFQETDRHAFTRDEEDGGESIGYFAYRDVIIARLDLAGFTAERAEKAFYAWLTDTRETYAGYGEWATDTCRALETLNYDIWKMHAREVLQTRYDFSRPHHMYKDELDRFMRSSSEEALFFSEDFLLSLRALLDAMPDIKEVWLDIGPLINGGWIESSEPICSTRRAPESFARSVLEPFVIITEGNTDVLVLRRSIQRLYPHLVDYVAFFDYDASNSDGGATWVVKFLKAFVAARINTLILAIFDNDAAGNDALIAAQALPLPANIKVMRLPDIELARAYPTVGPQGAHTVDINGSAVSIEIFTGRRNLIGPDGRLAPIVWGNFIKSVQRYQGALQDKSAPLARFMKDTEQHDDSVNYGRIYPEMKFLWENIFDFIKSSRAK